MFFMPRADFWRPWIVALALSLAAIAGWSAFERAHAATLRASFYGAESGRVTACGAFHPEQLTAAHPSWPCGTRFRACLAGHCGVGVVTDRGPARWTGRDIDLSRGLARAIGLERRGVAFVDVAVLGREPLPRPHPLRHVRRRGHHHH